MRKRTRRRERDPRDKMADCDDVRWKERRSKSEKEKRRKKQ